MPIDDVGWSNKMHCMKLHETSWNMMRHYETMNHSEFLLWNGAIRAQIGFKTFSTPRDGWNASRLRQDVGLSIPNWNRWNVPNSKTPKNTFQLAGHTGKVWKCSICSETMRLLRQPRNWIFSLPVWKWHVVVGSKLFKCTHALVFISHATQLHIT